jgi:hypothetical protein
MRTAVTSAEYNQLVWRPDWRGRSASSSPARSPTARHRATATGAGGAGYWQLVISLLGCIFFGISAIASYVVPATAP